MDNPTDRPPGGYFQDRFDEERGLLDDPMNRMSDLQPEEMRRGFIRKVYGILSIQMLATVALIVPFYTVPELKVFVILNPGLAPAASIITIVFMCVICCKPQLARTFPQNYFLLAGFTLSLALFLGCTLVHQTGVLVAAAVTTILVIALTIFAVTTDIDFSGMSPYLFCASIALLCFGILAGVLQIPWLTTLWASLGAFLFSIYLIHDTQTIVGGKHISYQIGVDDYVFAALVLYLDIINLFLYILHLVGGGRD
jgi:FtsH-binding integral membrane protein